ncbi:unnamed protein product [Amoebophrya sp. A120]|nr:unnamed protein product [Amoebophrya sp. A120]|eukprot:GSA120T00003048001.1
MQSPPPWMRLLFPIVLVAYFGVESQWRGSNCRQETTFDQHPPSILLRRSRSVRTLAPTEGGFVLFDSPRKKAGTAGASQVVQRAKHAELDESSRQAEKAGAAGTKVDSPEAKSDGVGKTGSSASIEERTKAAVEEKDELAEKNKSSLDSTRTAAATAIPVVHRRSGVASSLRKMKGKGIYDKFPAHFEVTSYDSFHRSASTSRKATDDGVQEKKVSFGIVFPFHGTRKRVAVAQKAWMSLERAMRYAAMRNPTWTFDVVLVDDTQESHSEPDYLQSDSLKDDYGVREGLEAHNLFSAVEPASTSGSAAAPIQPWRAASETIRTLFRLFPGNEKVRATMYTTMPLLKLKKSKAKPKAAPPPAPAAVPGPLPVVGVARKPARRQLTEDDEAPVFKQAHSAPSNVVIRPRAPGVPSAGSHPAAMAAAAPSAKPVVRVVHPKELAGTVPTIVQRTTSRNHDAKVVLTPTPMVAATAPSTRPPQSSSPAASHTTTVLSASEIDEKLGTALRSDQHTTAPPVVGVAITSTTTLEPTTTAAPTTTTPAPATLIPPPDPNEPGAKHVVWETQDDDLAEEQRVADLAYHSAAIQVVLATRSQSCDWPSPTDSTVPEEAIKSKTEAPLAEVTAELKRTPGSDTLQVVPASETTTAAPAVATTVAPGPAVVAAGTTTVTPPGAPAPKRRMQNDFVGLYDLMESFASPPIMATPTTSNSSSPGTHQPALVLEAEMLEKFWNWNSSDTRTEGVSEPTAPAPVSPPSGDVSALPLAASIGSVVAAFVGIVRTAFEALGNLFDHFEDHSPSISQSETKGNSSSTTRTAPAGSNTANGALALASLLEDRTTDGSFGSSPEPPRRRLVPTNAVAGPGVTVEENYQIKSAVLSNSQKIAVCQERSLVLLKAEDLNAWDAARVGSTKPPRTRQYSRRLLPTGSGLQQSAKPAIFENAAALYMGSPTESPPPESIANHRLVELRPRVLLFTNETAKLPGRKTSPHHRGTKDPSRGPESNQDLDLSVRLHVCLPRAGCSVSGSISSHLRNGFKTLLFGSSEKLGRKRALYTKHIAEDSSGRDLMASLDKEYVETQGEYLRSYQEQEDRIENAKAIGGKSDNPDAGSTKPSEVKQNNGAGEQDSNTKPGMALYYRDETDLDFILNLDSDLLVDKEYFVNLERQFYFQKLLFPDIFGKEKKAAIEKDKKNQKEAKKLKLEEDTAIARIQREQAQKARIEENAKRIVQAQKEAAELARQKNAHMNAVVVVQGPSGKKVASVTRTRPQRNRRALSEKEAAPAAETNATAPAAAPVVETKASRSLQGTANDDPIPHHELPYHLQPKTRAPEDHAPVGEAPDNSSEFSAEEASEMERRGELLMAREADKTYYGTIFSTYVSSFHGIFGGASYAFDLRTYEICLRASMNTRFLERYVTRLDYLHNRWVKKRLAMKKRVPLRLRTRVLPGSKPTLPWDSALMERCEESKAHLHGARNRTTGTQASWTYHVYSNEGLHPENEERPADFQGADWFNIALATQPVETHSFPFL